MELVIAMIVGLVAGWFFGRRAGQAAPEFASDDSKERTAAKVALDERLEERHARIMEKVRAEGRITNDGVEELFCISDRTASVYLGQLVDEGKLERYGVGRGTYYTSA